ncbi:LuxR C-terminal-related transcriptional regulator [Deinococcus ficus]|uniref:LuxR family transcriptional regulator n=1 Tax=Deinococcus ficus TaxID=317577 RepID=A0A221T102_9DEIO|nr:LuxR C-terminal-related transcriptional regulator [Deinococcus ficus]ASN82577.1 LuxR family transcriptional regulator [Deinococcus ficus]
MTTHKGTGGLPARPNTLVGRDEALQVACRLLGDRRIRLLTLRGPGGVGKTRLALDLAYRLGPTFDLGAAWVKLADLRSPAEVLPAIARALRVPGLDQAGLVEHLQLRSLLLVLDNFEHLTPAAAEVAALAADAPRLRLLVTSRTALHVRGEHELPLRPLALPGPSADGRTSPAVQLFVECARRVDPAFELTPAAERAVVRICELLDGLPLALELAAARLRAVSPEGLLAWLSSPLEVLSGGPRDGPHHGHSLRSTVGWSVDLLTPEEREVFAACGVFVGGLTLPALETVTGSAQARAALIGLAEHSLVHPAGGAEPRWTMLEPVREFAAEVLGGRSDAEKIRERHARYYLTLAEQAQPRVQEDEEERARLRADDANLTAALAWLVQTERTPLALRLMQALEGVWEHDVTPKHHEWLRRVVALPGAEREPALLAEALLALGVTSRNLQRLDQALDALQAAGALYRQLGDAAGEADVLLLLASAYSSRGEHERALPLFRRAQASYEARNDLRRMNDVANNLGVAYLRAGQPWDAQRCFARTEELSVALGSEQGLAFARALLSWSAYLLGQLDTARALAPLAWQHLRRVPNLLLRYTVLYHMAFHARDAGQVRLAARLIGCSETMRAGTGEPWDSCFRAHAAGLDAELRAAWGAPYLEWRAEGCALSLDELAPDVEALLDHLAAPASPAGLAPLTARERDVLRLLAQGIPDKKIALHLQISATTVSKHVSSMLAKLEVHNRVELARWALGQGLVEGGEDFRPGS